MISDMTGLPALGGAALGLGVYALVSAYVTGPLVMERTTEKSGWARTCQQQVRNQTERQQSPGFVLPKLDYCAAILGGIYGAQGEAFCGKHGGSLPFNMLNDLQRQQEAARQSRIDQAASSAATRCECAVSTVLEDRRTAFAIYAGSFRLITPMPVKALRSELRVALNSPACAMKE
ncbi:MAG: hypothetical protein WDN25_13650 [Acetobacteraceae bacterium]